MKRLRPKQTCSATSGPVFFFLSSFFFLQVVWLELFYWAVPGMCRSYTGAGYPGRRGQVQASARYVRVGTPLAGGGAKWPHPASHW